MYSKINSQVVVPYHSVLQQWAAVQKNNRKNILGYLGSRQWPSDFKIFSTTAANYDNRSDIENLFRVLTQIRDPLISFYSKVCNKKFQVIYNESSFYSITGTCMFQKRSNHLNDLPSVQPNYHFTNP